MEEAISIQGLLEILASRGVGFSVNFEVILSEKGTTSEIVATVSGPDSAIIQSETIVGTPYEIEEQLEYGWLLHP